MFYCTCTNMTFIGESSEDNFHLNSSLLYLVEACTVHVASPAASGCGLILQLRAGRVCACAPPSHSQEVQEVCALCCTDHILSKVCLDGERETQWKSQLIFRRAKLCLKSPDDCGGDVSRVHEGSGWYLNNHNNGARELLRQSE